MEPTEEPLTRVRVADRMQPVRATIPAFATAESARRRLEQETLRFLVVVAPGTGKLVGAVDPESLAPKPCCERLNGRCTVVQHLAPGVAFCFPGEAAREVEEDEADLAARGHAPAERRIPLLVVDERLTPLGCFAGTKAVVDDAPAATPRAA